MQIAVTVLERFPTHLIIKTLLKIDRSRPYLREAYKFIKREKVRQIEQTISIQICSHSHVLSCSFSVLKNRFLGRPSRMKSFCCTICSIQRIKWKKVKQFWLLFCCWIYSKIFVMPSNVPPCDFCWGRHWFTLKWWLHTFYSFIHDFDKKSIIQHFLCVIHCITDLKLHSERRKID